MKRHTSTRRTAGPVDGGAIASAGLAIGVLSKTDLLAADRRAIVAAVMMPTLRSGSSCSSWNAAPKARLVARSMAFTFGRSKVTSMTWPRFSTRTGLVILSSCSDPTGGLYHDTRVFVDGFRHFL